MEETKIEKTERDLLKEKADLLGIEYAGNISTEKLRELVNKANEPLEDKKEDKASNTNN